MKYAIFDRVSKGYAGDKRGKSWGFCRLPFIGAVRLYDTIEQAQAVIRESGDHYLCPPGGQKKGEPKVRLDLIVVPIREAN